MNVFCDNKQIGEFIRDINGYFIFFPNDLDGKSYSCVGYTESFLSGLSRVLKQANKPWSDQLKAYRERTNKNLAEQFELNLELTN